MRVNVPYLATIWATGSFDYSQYTARSMERRKILEHNPNLFRVRCRRPHPFYMERSFQFDLSETMTGNYVHFEVAYLFEKREGKNKFEYILSDGFFYQRGYKDTLINIENMRYNNLFDNDQKSVCKDNPYYETYRQDFFLAAFNDLTHNVIIVDDEDRKLPVLMERANDCKLYDGHPWVKMRNSYPEPFFHRGFEPGDDENEEVYNINHRYGIRPMSVWQLRNREDFVIRVLGGDTSLLDLEECRSENNSMLRWRYLRDNGSLTPEDAMNPMQRMMNAAPSLVR